MDKTKSNIIVYHYRNGMVLGCVDGHCCGVFGDYWVGTQHLQHASDHAHSAELNTQQISDNARDLRVTLALKLKT